MSWFSKNKEIKIENKLPETLDELILDIAEHNPKDTVIWTAGSLTYILNLIKKEIHDKTR